MIRGIYGIHHVAISVNDISRAEEFYVDALGFDLLARYDFEPSELADSITGLNNCSARTIMLSAGNVHLEIFQFTSPEPAGHKKDRPVCNLGYTHIALDVDPECIQSVYNELEEAGVRWHHPASDTGDNVVMTYGRDPFGNVIEIQALDSNCRFHIKRLPRFCTRGNH